MEVTKEVLITYTQLSSSVMCSFEKRKREKVKKAVTK